MVNSTAKSGNWQKKRILDSKGFQNIAFDEVNELLIRERAGRKLFLTSGEVLIDFISCSYLGLDLDKRVIEASSNNIYKCGVTFPAARTRAVVESFGVLETLLNKIFCDSFSTIFSSLHLAHLGFIPMLGSGELPSFPINSNGPVFIVDKNAHASIQINRALMMQFGTVEIINLVETHALEVLLKNCVANQQTPIMIADSIGSMGGSVPVTLLYSLVEKYDGYLYLDDAHGTSVFGRYGCGYVLECLDHFFPKRLILASSLSKAFGGVAGVIALPTHADSKMIKRYSQTYIFGGPPPLSIIDSAIASARIHLTEEIRQLQDKLWDNVKYFDEVFGSRAINYGVKSPIRGILIGDEFKTIKAAKILQREGFALTTAMYPTVEKGKGMLRVALSALHTKEDIDRFCAFSESSVIKYPKSYENTI
ncbi:MAG TPA: aminotransferase class I/II-fold pyridoxal phosphate-dependent enzyme [Gammaproteobacteria bacterium]|nr:aminotransferase class I/II-fold pyridoxal phosphate-dependent enzyme [Gammaproteobacteria bacterium]